MAFTPTKTWASGNTLNAADVTANLDDLKEYARHIEAGALRVSAGWADTRHFMEGQYDATTNMTSMVSGVYGGQNSGGLFSRATFVSRWNTTRGNSLPVNQKVLVPQTCFTLELHRPATVFFQWWMQVQTKKNYTNPVGTKRSRFYFAVVDTILGQGMTTQDATLQECPGMKSSGQSGQVLLDGTFNSNGHYLTKAKSQQVPFGIGIAGRSNADMGHVLAWGISVEAFYL